MLMAKFHVPCIYCFYHFPDESKCIFKNKFVSNFAIELVRHMVYELKENIVSNLVESVFPRTRKVPRVTCISEEEEEDIDDQCRYMQPVSSLHQISKRIESESPVD